ncbi:MAG: DUF2147 domain-containing protein [Nevskia sp.]|nr:DUF2147 domain-containing protein [Nevskia sp.]
MRRIGALFVGLTMVAATVSAFAQTATEARPSLSPLGRWRTFDPDGHELRSIVVIAAVGDELQGKVVERFPPPGDPTHGICGACSGELKDQPILGMTLLRHLRKHGDGWDGGSIVDPTTGKTYSVEAELANGGQELHLRGYVGISLFGQTRTWVRDTSGSH